MVINSSLVILLLFSFLSLQPQKNEKQAKPNRASGSGSPGISNKNEEIYECCRNKYTSPSQPSPVANDFLFQFRNHLLVPWTPCPLQRRVNLISPNPSVAKQRHQIGESQRQRWVRPGPDRTHIIRAATVGQSSETDVTSRCEKTHAHCRRRRMFRTTE